MDQIELVRLKKNIFEDVQELLENYYIRDERLNQEITEKVAEAYLERRGL